MLLRSAVIFLSMEVVVIALDLEPMPVAMIKLTDVESGRVLANLEGATPFAQCREMLVVVFGPVERGDAVVRCSSSSDRMR